MSLITADYAGPPITSGGFQLPPAEPHTPHPFAKSPHSPVRPPTLVPGTADRVGWPLALLGLGWLAGFGCLCSDAALYELGAGGDGGVDDCPDWVGVVCLVEASDFPLVRGGLGVDHAEFFEDADLPWQSTPLATPTRRPLDTARYGGAAVAVAVAAAVLWGVRDHS